MTRCLFLRRRTAPSSADRPFDAHGGLLRDDAESFLPLAGVQESFSRAMNELVASLANSGEGAMLDPLLLRWISQSALSVDKKFSDEGLLGTIILGFSRKDLAHFHCF